MPQKAEKKNLMHRITGFLDFFHRPVLLGVETRRFGNEIGWDVVGWMDMAQDRYQWRALMNTVLNLRVP
jgi:hypothetical protein